MAKQNFKNRLLQGWQQLFGGSKQESNSMERKPFPKDHFFYPEELDFLAKKDSLTTIEKWALATGKWAYEQGRNRNADCQYSMVKWQDGLMATWVDGRMVPDTPSRQVEKLALLKEEGFEMPEKYEKAITNFEASRLVGSYFTNGNDIIKIEDYDKGHLIGDAPKFMLRRWNKDNFMETDDTMEYAYFKNEIGKSVIFMSDEEKKDFNQRLNEYERGKLKLNKTIEIIAKSSPTMTDGKLPLEYQYLHNTNSEHGKIFPTNWILLDKDLLSIYADAEDKKDIYKIDIKDSNAFKYQSILDTIMEAVEKERINNEISSIVSILGKSLGENKIYAKENNSVIFPANEGNVNAIVATNDGRVIPFNLNTHKEVPLAANEPGYLLVAMQSEGDMVRQKLRDEISIPKMKDYVESLRDKENLLSGEWDYIPSHTTLDKLFCDYQNKDEEFHAYINSSFPMAVEDRNEMLADLEAAHLAFNQEMKKMVDAYNNHSYSFNDNDIKKMEQLDDILGGKGKNQTIRHHKVSHSEELTKDEVALRDSLVEKMRRNGMDVITDADEAKKVHREASPEVKEMGSRVFNKMKEIGTDLKEYNLSEAQQAIVKVYSGQADNLSFSVNRNKGNKTIVMRQGNELHAGVKHSLFGHYGTNKGSFTSKEILLIPDIINKGVRDDSKGNGRVSYRYVSPNDNIKYTVVTEPRNDREYFCDFYTNKKALSLKTYSLEDKTNTNLIAHNDNDNASYVAKVQQNNDTAKEKDNKLNEFKTSKGEIWGFTTDGKIYLDPSVANAETPIHEYTHIWADAIRENNPKEWENIVSLMKGTPLWDQVKGGYPELKTEGDIADEVLATYSGKLGAERLRKDMSNLTSHGNMNEKAAASRTLGRVQYALSKFWKAVSDFLHIHFTSAEDVAERPLKDLLDGVDPRVYIKDSLHKTNTLSPIREQRMQQTQQESRFIDPTLLAIKTDGRWHTQEHLEKEAYKAYGSLLADSKGLTIANDGTESIPMDLGGHKYDGATALMLNIASHNNGYEVPVFINIATMSANGIRVKENAAGIPVITKQGVENVYNIELTDYPTQHPQEYNNMKLNQVLEARLSSENKEAIVSLVNNNRFTTKTAFDAPVGSATYSVSNNTIHVAPSADYDKKDGFLQDLSEGLVMSTRKSEPSSSRFENILKEGLIVHLGSGMVGQKYGYDVGETTGSKFWKERLKNDPIYTKAVVNAAERSSMKIIDYVEKLQKGQNQSSNLDLRSTTPIDIDVDGNGIMESQENLAADKKQGASEEEGNGQDEVHHQEHKFHRGR